MSHETPSAHVEAYSWPHRYDKETSEGKMFHFVWNVLTRRGVHTDPNNYKILEAMLTHWESNKSLKDLKVLVATESMPKLPKILGAKVSDPVLLGLLEKSPRPHRIVYRPGDKLVIGDTGLAILMEDCLDGRTCNGVTRKRGYYLVTLSS